jgi:hypothetical protein
MSILPFEFGWEQPSGRCWGSSQAKHMLTAMDLMDMSEGAHTIFI